MNRKQALLFSVGVVILPIAATYGQPYAMGTAFTYQGQLMDDGSPANGQYDFEFALCDDPAAACVLASTTVEDHQVDEGLFTVEVDFGADVFNGEARWLELGVRPGADSGADPYTTLSPRQELTPTPHALRAKTGVGGPDALNVTGDDKVGIGTNSPTEELDVAGNIHASGTITSGSSITIDGVNDKIECPSTMELHVGGDRAFRLEPAKLAPNVIGGIDNSAGAWIYGASIGGGGPGWPQGSFRCDGETPNNCAVCEGGLDHGFFCNSSQWCREGGICVPDDANCVESVCVWFAQYRCSAGPEHGYICGVCVLGSNDGNPCGWDLNCPDGTCEPDGTACGAPGVCAVGTTGNTVTDPFGTIGGGSGNIAGDFQAWESALFATVGGGELNMAMGQYATIGGGSNNTVEHNAWGATIAGGQYNTAAVQATVGGGDHNTATAGSWGSTIAGGSYNIASGANASVGGGWQNVASGFYATVPGGSDNEAGGLYSFAGGCRAKVRNNDQTLDNNGDEGTFVWADATWADFTSNGPNRFLVRASGGTWFYSSSDLLAGSYLAAGAGAWASISDRNLKENVSSVNGREVLRKLDGIPVTTWNYKTEDAAIRHMGPMAQDLHAAFGLGDSEKSIGTIDADGVALAAIQGLHEIVKDKDAEIADLEARLSAIEKLMKQAITGQEGGAR